jgi:hypothetical protein
VVIVVSSVQSAREGSECMPQHVVKFNATSVVREGEVTSNAECQ